MFIKARDITTHDSVF